MNVIYASKIGVIGYGLKVKPAINYEFTGNRAETTDN